MDSTHVEEGELISVFANFNGQDKCIFNFLTGIVIEDQTNRFQIGSRIMTPELDYYASNIFITDEIAMYETSEVPKTTKVSCTEFLLMRLNGLGLSEILRIRECDSKKNLISLFLEQSQIQIVK